MTECSELYIYYRLRPEDAPAARAAFELARGQAQVRLAQRVEPPLTWMEVYSGAAQGLEPHIAAAMSPYVQGERHREIFTTLSAKPLSP